MSFEPTDVYVETAAGDPLEGVLVKVYDLTGSLFYAQAITTIDGRASFLLETLNYSLRFYKFQTGFAQPQLITVLPAPEVNIFSVQGEPFMPPMATDPRLCRCSGYFRDITGAPQKNLDIHFIAEFNPLLLEEAAIVTEEVRIRTDETGYAQIDLIRYAMYNAFMEATGSDQLRCIAVPNLASTNLPDLLFPRIERIIFGVAGPIGLAPGQSVTLTPTVYDSAGRPLTGTALSDLKWTMGDDQIACITEITKTTLTVRGNAEGTTQLIASRLDSSIIRIPNTPIVGVPVDVEVVAI